MVGAHFGELVGGQVFEVTSDPVGFRGFGEGGIVGWVRAWPVHDALGAVVLFLVFEVYVDVDRFLFFGRWVFLADPDFSG